MSEDSEIVRRCRDRLHPAGQAATDAEVVAACEGTLWLASVRLNVALRELLGPITEPIERLLGWLTRATIR